MCCNPEERILPSMHITTFELTKANWYAVVCRCLIPVSKEKG